MPRPVTLLSSFVVSVPERHISDVLIPFLFTFVECVSFTSQCKEDQREKMVTFPLRYCIFQPSYPTANDSPLETVGLRVVGLCY